LETLAWLGDRLKPPSVVTVGRGKWDVFGAPESWCDTRVVGGL
jgi:hypothetical protein